MPKEERKLRDLVSVGPAMLEDFELLGITSVSQLRRRSPQRMYHALLLERTTDRSLLSRCVRGRGRAGERSRPAN